MILEKFLTLETVSRAIKEFGEIKHLDEINTALLWVAENNLKPKAQNHWYHLARLSIMAAKEEVVEAFKNRVNKASKSAAMSEESCVLYYGKTYGRVVWGDRLICLSNQGKNEAKRRAELPQEEKEEFFKRNSESLKKSHEKKRGEGYNYRQNSPLCEEYYKIREITDAEYIERAILSYKMKSWVYSYTPEERVGVYERKMSTQRRNEQMGKVPKSAGFSKAANQFFNKVLFKLPTEISSKIISIPTTNSEYWVRDWQDKTKYYFADLCIPGILVVEYNGHPYHPKSETDETWNWSSLIKMSCQEKWKRDRRKIDSFIKSNYTVLEIWDDDLDVDLVVTFIKDTYEQHKTQSLDAGGGPEESVPKPS